MCVGDFVECLWCVVMLIVWVDVGCLVLVRGVLFDGVEGFVFFLFCVGYMVFFG